jgi:hypothetical protein
MQADSNYIYNKVSTDNQLDIDFVTAVGDFIQKEVANNLRSPESLIVKVKGLGNWHLRRMRLQSSFKNLSEYDQSKIKSEEQKENLKLYLERMKARLEEYDIYLSEKAKKREIKNDYYKKSGEDNS